MTEITNEQLDGWQRLADAATPGVWAARLDQYGWVESIHSETGPVVEWWASESVGDGGLAARENDINFICHSRSAVPALIAEVRRLREQLKTAVAEEREACAEIASLKHARVYPIEEYGVRLAIFERIRARGAKEQS